MSDNILQRWSRRKIDAGKAIDPPPADPVGVTDQPVAAALDLTAIEDLTAASDYRQFMQEGVPAALRALALSKLWRSDPTIAAMDLLDIHNLDYSTPAEESVASAWSMAKGYLSHLGTPSSGDNGLETTMGSNQLSETGKNDTPDTGAEEEKPAQAG